MKQELHPFLIEMAEKLWPVSAFASREEWLAYAEKWIPIITKSKK